MTDYFSKRVEAKAYKKIQENEVIDFIWDHIICKFRVPREITCNNGPQFVGEKITEFLERLKIKRIASSPYHPCANGQAKSTNKILVQNIKKKLKDAKGRWPEELLGVLWAYRTTAKTSIEETPFFVVYGAEALIPIEIGEPSIRYTHTTKESNQEVMAINLDMLEEHREKALIRMVAQKQRVERYFNRKTNLKDFKGGDYVLRPRMSMQGLPLEGHVTIQPGMRVALFSLTEVLSQMGFTSKLQGGPQGLKTLYSLSGARQDHLEGAGSAPSVSPNHERKKEACP
ncbi:uncharacterized protein LOC132048949 [Lycium ferocissimum]|uniref:uncharacterized protein LOC132048949 n=1 Tax=Lycium ferocissimum TaxID=112874 RepID=UPI0028155285|nr:uncharacterized protein LOC132048949 [Lycium ferocissimum]